MIRYGRGQEYVIIHVRYEVWNYNTLNVHYSVTNTKLILDKCWRDHEGKIIQQIADKTRQWWRHAYMGRNNVIKNHVQELNHALKVVSRMVIWEQWTNGRVVILSKISIPFYHSNRFLIQFFTGIRDSRGQNREQNPFHLETKTGKTWNHAPQE